MKRLISHILLTALLVCVALLVALPFTASLAEGIRKKAHTDSLKEVQIKLEIEIKKLELQKLNNETK